MKRPSRTKQETFVACRVLTTKRERKDYVVLPSSEVPRRHDIKKASKAFATEAEAKAEIERLGGTIPTGSAMFLDFYEGEHLRTVWCWKDERTYGASQEFGSEEEALDAWHNDKLVFDPPPDD
jgi:hypothetical protein